MEDDYINNKAQLKVKSVSAKNATVNVKAALDLSKQSFSNEVKLQFPWNNHFLWLGVRKNKELKFHVDFGTKECSKCKTTYVPFFNWKTNTDFECGT